MGRRTPVLHLAGLLVAALAAALLHRQMPITSRAEQGEPFIPRPELARATALGFDAVLADYYWLRAVQIVGGAASPEAHGRLLGRLIDVTTTLNPWVDHPYRFAAVWMIGDREVVRQANRLLERGIAHHPDEWRNRFYLGFNLFYYLRRDAEAAEVLDAAARMPEAPSYLRALVARLRAQGEGGLDAAEILLREALRETDDPRAEGQYETALAEVRTERVARALDRARARYRERAGRDITRLQDLVRGPHAVLRALPPEPNGARWELHPESGRIVSSHYGHRYELRGLPELPEASGEALEGQRA